MAPVPQVYTELAIVLAFTASRAITDSEGAKALALSLWTVVLSCGCNGRACTLVRRTRVSRAYTRARANSCYLTVTNRAKNYCLWSAKLLLVFIASVKRCSLFKWQRDG